MGVQLRKSMAWFGKSRDSRGFYERGRHVPHNRDVRYSPTHSELLSGCTEPAWPALVTVATC